MTPSWLARLKRSLCNCQKTIESANVEVLSTQTTLDQGLLHPDQPQTRTDLYNRQTFAQQLARMLILPPSSHGVVVGIEGAWGSGKTTVVRYILETLRATGDNGPIVVEFNPWMLAGADALVEALLTELASGIGINTGKNRQEKSLKVAKKILGYASLLRHLKYMKYVPGISFAGIAAETVGDALHSAGEFATKAGDGADAAKKVVTEAEQLVSVKSGLAQRKKEVIQALSELDCSIIVVVDDLDRLTPDETKAVFRTIKAVADFPRIAYLLAYDRNVISENLGGGEIAGGSAYIEKIIQVTYPIAPAFPWQLQAHLSKALQNILQQIRRELRPFESALLNDTVRIASNLCRHPRDIIRLTNRLMFSLANTAKEVNACDVVVAEALFQRFPDVRDKIIQSPQYYIGSRWSYEDTLQATDWSLYLPAAREHAREAWKEGLPEDEADNKVCSSALQFLFPIPNGSTSNARPPGHLRISERSRLIRFFAQTSMDGVQDVEEIERMLGCPKGIGEMLNAYDLEKAKEMVLHFSSYLDIGENVDYPQLIKEVASACTLEKLRTDSGRYFSHSVATLISNCLEKCQNAAPELVPHVIDNMPLTFGLDLLLMLGMRHEEIRGVQEYKAKEAPLYIQNSDVVSQGIEIWRGRAKDSFKSGAITQGNELFTMLYGLAKLGKTSNDLDAHSALKTMCTTIPGGVEFFLLSAKPYRELQGELFYHYLWNSDEMAELVEKSSLAADFDWYIDCLRNNVGIRNSINQRNGNQE